MKAAGLSSETGGFHIRTNITRVSEAGILKGIMPLSRRRHVAQWAIPLAAAQCKTVEPTINQSWSDYAEINCVCSLIAARALRMYESKAVTPTLFSGSNSAGGHKLGVARSALRSRSRQYASAISLCGNPDRTDPDFCIRRGLEARQQRRCNPQIKPCKPDRYSVG